MGAGYGGKERRLFISVSEAINLPVIITIIDKKEQVELLYPFLEENLRQGVATVEVIQMLETNFVREEYKKRIASRDNPAEEVTGCET